MHYKKRFEECAAREDSYACLSQPDKKLFILPEADLLKQVGQRVQRSLGASKI
jgi:hypothetical protein